MWGLLIFVKTSSARDLFKKNALENASRGAAEPVNVDNSAEDDTREDASTEISLDRIAD